MHFNTAFYVLYKGLTNFSYNLPLYSFNKFQKSSNLGPKQHICFALYHLLVALFVKILLGFEWKGHCYLKGEKKWKRDLEKKIFYVKYAK